MLLLKKIKREVGFNFIHGLRGIHRSLWTKLQRPKVEFPGKNGVIWAPIYLNKPKGKPVTKKEFLTLKERSNANDFFWYLKEYSRRPLAKSITPAVLGDVFTHLDSQKESWYRAFKLSGWDHDTTKNDHWEFHMVPWHRWFGDFAECYIDERFRPYLDGVFDRFDVWKKEHRPWMTMFTTGSNISGVVIGYAFHALLGMVYRGDKKYTKQYKKYYRKVRRNLKYSYDVTKLYSKNSTHFVSVPHEGVLYSTFLLWSAVQFDKFQRQLGIVRHLFTESEIKYLQNYLSISKTKDKGWHTSGDSRAYDVMGHVVQYLDALFPTPIFDDFVWCVSKKKGEILFNFSSNKKEQVMMVIHANRSLPFLNTLHFGLKPGHYMVYDKNWNEEGHWLVKDPGYVNYFREDYTDIDKNLYNSHPKQKLFTRGRVKTKTDGDWIVVTIKTWNPWKSVTFKFNKKDGTYIV